MADDVTKLTVNLPASVAQALKTMASERNTTVTEVLKSAIGTEKFISESVQSGSKVLVEKSPGNVRELVFPNLPPKR